LHHSLFDNYRDNTLFFEQKGGDIGDKMLYSIEHGLKRSRQVIVVGSDCLGVTAQMIESMITQFKHSDAVFIPAHDGGFVAWGVNMKAFHDIDISNIPWGTSLVWNKMRLGLEYENISYSELNPSWDIDTLSELKKHKMFLPASIVNYCLENSIKL
jgi:uncharacterized protein